jgi:hypothetical protein
MVNVNVSGPIRVFALVGVLAALGLAVWLFLLGGLSPAAGTGAAAEIKPLHPVGKSATPVVLAPKAKARSKARPARPAPAKAKARPTNAKPAKAKPRAVPNPNGLPRPLAQALVRHAVVVVSLYNPEGKVDRISLAEAKAGAERAGVGFVALNVLDKRHSEALTRKLGVLPAPAFFLYQRPGDLVMRVDGFADRDVVAQSAVSATPPGKPLKVRPRPAVIQLEHWSREANGVCAKTVASVPRLSAGASLGQFLGWAPGLLAAEKRELASLQALALPTARPERARAQRLLGVFRDYQAGDQALYDAAKRRGKQAAARLLGPQSALGERGNGLARELGAPACAHFNT